MRALTENDLDEELNKYTVTAIFSELESLQRSKRTLRRKGIAAKNIDEIVHFTNKRKAYLFQRSHKGFKLGFWGYLAGLILGATLSFFVNFDLSLSVAWGSFTGPIADALGLALLVGVVGMIVGFLFGRQMSHYILRYQKVGPKFKQQGALAVNINADQRELVEAILKSEGASNIDIVDNRQEVELGVRSHD